MSCFSGRCDLFDHMMMEKMYDKGNVKVSDEYECFEIFKKRTGGVIHQHYKVEVNKYNCENILQKCPQLKVIDKDLYEYWGKQYTLKQLNKHGVYVQYDIHFNTLLDLIPYYPYVVTMCSGDIDHETVFIANESEVDRNIAIYLKNGFNIATLDHYKKELQKHYKDVVLRYFNPEGRVVCEVLDLECLDESIDIHNFKLKYPIDINHKIEVARTQHDWIYGSVKIVDANNGIVDISNVWPHENVDLMIVQYVKKVKFPLYLD